MENDKNCITGLYRFCGPIRLGLSSSYTSDTVIRAYHHPYDALQHGIGNFLHRITIFDGADTEDGAIGNTYQVEIGPIDANNLLNEWAAECIKHAAEAIDGSVAEIAMLFAFDVKSGSISWARKEVAEINRLAKTPVEEKLKLACNILIVDDNTYYNALCATIEAANAVGMYYAGFGYGSASQVNDFNRKEEIADQRDRLAAIVREYIDKFTYTP